MTVCGVYKYLHDFREKHYRMVVMKVDYLRAFICCVDDAKLRGTDDDKEEFIMRVMRTIPNFSRNISNDRFFGPYLDYNKLDIYVDFENAIELFEMGGIL